MQKKPPTPTKPAHTTARTITFTLDGPAADALARLEALGITDHKGQPVSADLFAEITFRDQIARAHDALIRRK